MRDDILFILEFEQRRNGPEGFLFRATFIFCVYVFQNRRLKECAAERMCDLPATHHDFRAVFYRILEM
jgi:hypothetical protein